MIKPSIRKKKYYKIYKDDEFLGSIPERFVPAEYFINPEKEISEDFLIFVQEWVYKNAQDKLLDYLSKIEKPVYDCRLFLKRHEMPDDVISVVIKEAEERNWVSDKRYAEMYISDSIYCGRSSLEIKHNLLLKKIDVVLIDNLLKEGYNEDTQNEVLENLISSLLKRYENIEKGKLFEKIATTLYRKGFKYNEYEDILRKRIVSGE